MLDSLIQRSKSLMVTLRFSILAIFVTLFVMSMLVLITITHLRFVQSMERLSFELMQQASDNAFNQIQSRIQKAEMKSQSVAQLIKLSVVDFKNDAELISYTIHFMQNEISLSSGIQAIAWGDVSGDFVMAERKQDGRIFSEVIERTKKPPYHKTFIQDASGKAVEISYSDKFTYDPRTRPWFIAAMNAKKPVWLGIYYYQLTGHQGTGVSTPVFKNDGSLLGVVNLQVRLENLQQLVEQTKVSQNSVVFIVSAKGKVIAYPHSDLLDRPSLLNIQDLKKAPWVIKSFELFNEMHQSDFAFDYNGHRYLATYEPLSSFGKEQWIIGIVTPADDFISYLNRTHLITLFINLLILIFGITAVSILTTRVVRPLKKITQEIVRIKNFDLEGREKIVSRIKEISYIADALYSMKKGLRTFQRYIPASLVRQLIETGEDARIGGVKKPLAILFSDIKDFTTIAEQVDPDILTPHICQYFDELSHIIVLNNGTIDKYIGDAIMAFWGAPQAIDKPALHAAKAALRCINRSAQLNQQWKAEGKPVLFTRIGIHLGDAIVGNFGSSERINYTAVGDATNVASRLEGINKIYGTQIIVSESIYQQIKNDFMLRMIDCVTVKGKHDANYIYELIAESRAEVNYDLENYITTFMQGYSAYKKSHWDESIKHFRDCLAIYPEDKVAHIFISRCEHFKMDPPAGDWQGIWQLNEK